MRPTVPHRPLPSPPCARSSPSGPTSRSSWPASGASRGRPGALRPRRLRHGASPGTRPTAPLTPTVSTTRVPRRRPPRRDRAQPRRPRPWSTCAGHPGSRGWAWPTPSPSSTGPAASRFAHNGELARPPPASASAYRAAGRIHGKADSEVGTRWLEDAWAPDPPAGDLLAGLQGAMGGSANLAVLEPGGAATLHAGNPENPVFGFRMGDLRCLSTGVYSLDRSLFRLVAPGAHRAPRRETGDRRDALTAARLSWWRCAHGPAAWPSWSTMRPRTVMQDTGPSGGRRAALTPRLHPETLLEHVDATGGTRARAGIGPRRL